jgi:hypothetical protein
LLHGDEFRDDYSSDFRTWYYIHNESFGGEEEKEGVWRGGLVMYYVKGMPSTYDYRLRRNEHRILARLQFSFTVSPEQRKLLKKSKIQDIWPNLLVPGHFIFI